VASDINLDKIAGEKVVISGDEIGFPEAGYFIELSRIDTAERLLAAALHISEKRWVNSALLRAFVGMAADHNRIDIRGF